MIDHKTNPVLSFLKQLLWVGAVVFYGSRTSCLVDLVPSSIPLQIFFSSTKNCCTMARNKNTKSHLVTQGSIRCGHVHGIVEMKCRDNNSCAPGDEPFQMITETCKSCKNDQELHNLFHDLEDKPSLFRYRYCRELNEDRHIWGPLKLGSGLRIPESISVETDEHAHETWREGCGRFVKFASRRASAVFMEGQGQCSIDELHSEKGKALLDNAIKEIIEKTKPADRKTKVVGRWSSRRGHVD